jgi:uncharacterized protein RhaS with RHS repeats
VTSAAYDNFGRRVTLVSPDSGRTDYVFDPASNLTQKIGANLKATGQAVNYSYQYNRLAAVTLSGSPPTTPPTPMAVSRATPCRVTR